MLEEQHRPRKGVPAAQRQGQGFSPFGGQGRFYGTADQRGRAHNQQQPDGQEVPGLQAHDAHHAHRRVGDVHRGHRAYGVDGGEHTQPSIAAAAQSVASRGTEQRSGQQHQRTGQVEERDGHIFPAEKSQLAQETIVLIECAQQNCDITQRIFQHEQKLRAAVDGAAALPGNGAVVVAQQRTVLLNDLGQQQRARQGAHGVPCAVELGFPLVLAQDHQWQHHPQQVNVGLGTVGEHTGGGVEGSGAAVPFRAGQQRQHQIIAGQQRSIVT